MSRRDPVVLMRDMLDHAREAHEAAEGHSRADLDTDRMLEIFLIHMIQVIGEAASRVPPDVRSQYPQVAWTQMIGARNVIVHGYAYIDLDLVWETVTESLPPLIAELERILAEKSGRDGQR